jgi:hydroxymethylbilane synthase
MIREGNRRRMNRPAARQADRERAVRAYVIGSRASRLALWQAGWVRDRLQAAGHQVRVETIHTSGDRVPDRPLRSFGGKGIFVKEIEESLLGGAIDLAVHSLKDLPTEQPRGLRISCVPAREDPHDLLLAPGRPDLGDLPPRSVVGTGSPRRACQIHAARPDLTIRDLRGNVETRLGRLEKGDYDAIVLALAGVKRIGAEVEGIVLDFDRMLPAVGQGALAIEARDDDGDAQGILKFLHHPATAVAVAAERAFLRALGGGCQAPIAAIADESGNRLRLRGLVGSADGTTVLRDCEEGAVDQPEEIGRTLAERLLKRGARELILRDTPGRPGVS